MGVVNGTNLRIYDGAVPLGYATSCTLDMSAETRETLSKDGVSSWAESEVGQLSASLSFEGFFSEDTTINAVTVKSIEDIFTKFSAKTALSWRFTTDVSTEVVYSGSGYITALNISAPVEENTTYSGTITVSGAVTQGSIT
jgi:TP901-1 family phage major tail protein